MEGYCRVYNCGYHTVLLAIPGPDGGWYCEGHYIVRALERLLLNTTHLTAVFTPVPDPSKPPEAPPEPVKPPERA